jgi:hypothetical protein
MKSLNFVDSGHNTLKTKYSIGNREQAIGQQSLITKGKNEMEQVNRNSWAKLGLSFAKKVFKFLDESSEESSASAYFFTCSFLVAVTLPVCILTK